MDASRSPTTKRDELWNAILTLAASGGKHTTDDVERATSDMIARRTILDCLRAMETSGWICLRDRGPHGMEFWLAGAVSLDDRDSRIPTTAGRFRH